MQVRRRIEICVDEYLSKYVRVCSITIQDDMHMTSIHYQLQKPTWMI